MYMLFGNYRILLEWSEQEVYKLERGRIRGGMVVRGLLREILMDVDL